jgi:hypothetical protein
MPIAPKEGARERKMKKTFYCVMSEFYDDGRVNAAMISRECGEKPQNSFRHVFRLDTYNDWFNTKEEAEAFLAEAKTATLETAWVIAKGE